MVKKFFFAVLLSVSVYSSIAAAEKYAVIRLDGVVNPVVSEYIKNSINLAAEDGNNFIVLLIDTPGGWMDSMRDIIKSMHTSKIPVVTFTFPRGARAASAGGFIMLASNIAAMAPGTEIGAMHPVVMIPDFLKQQNGGGTDNVMDKKILNDTVAYARSLAQKSGRNVKWAEEAVENAISSSYMEARKAGVIEIIADDIDDLMRKLDKRKIDFNGKAYTFSTTGIIKKEYLMTWKEKAVNRLADPQLLFVLFIIATVGIWLEIKNPGIIVPGTLGGISLILFLMGIKIIPINFVGLMLIILAFVFFILELKFTSFGLFALGGVVSFFIGALILFDSPLPGGGIPVSTIIGMLLFVLFFVFIVVRAVIKAHNVKSFTGLEGLLGKEGYALADFSGTGKIFLHGEIWNAEIEGDLKKGEKVIVEKADGLVLKIRKK
jgi:membrane-bound serine protease (ClpP class)